HTIVSFLMFDHTAVCVILLLAICQFGSILHSSQAEAEAISKLSSTVEQSKYESEEHDKASLYPDVVSQSESSVSESPLDASQSESSKSESSSDASQSESSDSESPLDASQSELSKSESSSEVNQSNISNSRQLSNGIQSASNASQFQPPPNLSARSKRRFNCSNRARLANESTVQNSVTLISSSDFAELRAALTAKPAPAPVDGLGSECDNGSGQISTNQSTQCAVLLYYLPYCPYSVALAPHFNALTRVFPGLHFFAAEADKVSPFYANYTTSMAPHIRIYGDREYACVNISLRKLDSLIPELANLTGHKPLPNVSLTESDFAGPVPTVLTQQFDYWLLLSSLYFIVFLLPWLASKFPRVRLCLARLLVKLTRLAGAAHEHAD
ncbi:hypothetical protein BOX15_Mlig015673g1, partial [Macrostomum lignano]